MKDTIVIVGQTCSGKTTLAKALEEKGYKRIVTYTTRPIRDGEIIGKDYFYMSKDEFKQKFADDFFAEIAVTKTIFGYWLYGSAKEDYQRKGKKVIVLNPDGVRSLDIPHTIVYLDLKDEILLERAKSRDYSIEEVKRRLDDDRMLFQMITKNPNLTLHITQEYDVDRLVEEVLKFTDKGELDYGRK